MLHRSAAIGLAGVASFVVATATPSRAQTWQWKYVTQNPNAPPLDAKSTVTIAGGQVHLQYTIPIQQRQVVIESCHAALADIGNATTIHSQGREFLLVQLKPARSAFCASGPRPAVALPTDSVRTVAGAIAAINHVCCTRATLVARATPAPPESTPPPDVAPSPVPTASPSLRVSTADWVERSGRSSFVRVLNTSPVALRVRNVEVVACRNVAAGCGSAARDLLVDPDVTVTVATVSSASEEVKPIFRYQYVAVHGSQTLARVGSSARAIPPRLARVPVAAERVAAADEPNVPSGSFAPPRLLKRGSSRLAIGITGTALIRLMIGGNGTPQEATVVTISDRRLTAAAIETAVSSTFAPATQNGKPVAAKYVATFTFDGEDPALAGIPVWKRSPAPFASTTPGATAAPALPAAGAPSIPASPPAPASATDPRPTVTPAPPPPAAESSPEPAVSPSPRLGFHAAAAPI